MLANAGATSPTWLYEILPVLVFLVAFASLLLGARSYFKDREKKANERRYREERHDRTSEWVLGRDADPDRGIDAIVGFRVIVPALQRRVDMLTEEIGDRAELADTSLLDLIHAIQQDVHQLVEEVHHAEPDDRPGTN